MPVEITPQSLNEGTDHACRWKGWSAWVRTEYINAPLLNISATSSLIRWNWDWRFFGDFLPKHVIFNLATGREECEGLLGAPRHSGTKLRGDLESLISINAGR